MSVFATILISLIVMKASGNPSHPTKASSIYEFSAKDIDGNDVSLKKYEGHVCIIVNIASK